MTSNRDAQITAEIAALPDAQRAAAVLFMVTQNVGLMVRHDLRLMSEVINTFGCAVIAALDTLNVSREDMDAGNEFARMVFERTAVLAEEAARSKLN
jgi:hypothetical protein